MTNTIQSNKTEKKKIVLFTFGGEGLSICEKLANEGHEVYIGMVDNNKDILLPEEKWKKEDENDKEKRFKNFDGIVKKEDAVVLYKWLIKQNPEDFFVWSDLNQCFKYTERLYKKGFTGLLATEEDRKMEVDRDLAKKFVEENYPSLKVGDHHEFTDIEEAITFLEEDEENCWVLKPKGGEAKVIAREDDVEMNHNEIIEALKTYKNDYESSGFILEKKIMNVCEITPEIVFWNGEPLFTTVDIETKYTYGGNRGSQCGCSSNLIVETNINDKINQLAFPPIIWEKAKEIRGLSIFDASLYLDEDGELYFGEYCAMREGWTSLWTKISMSEGASNYFTKIMNGENPLKNKYGVAVALFNDEEKVDEYIQYKPFIEDEVWLYDCYKKDDKLYTTGTGRDLGAITASSDDLLDSIEALYENVNDFSQKFTCRTKEDFLADSYYSALIYRLNKGIEHKLFKGDYISNYQLEESERNIMQDEMGDDEDMENDVEHPISEEMSIDNMI